MRRILSVSEVLLMAAAGSNVGRGVGGAELPVPEPARQLPSVVVTGVSEGQPLNLDVGAGTATRLGASLFEVPASAGIVTQDEMGRRGLRTVREAVESRVGTIAVDSPGNGATYSMRGFAGDDVQQLWDGIRILNPAMSARPLDSFNMERVEVLRGPASVLHGEGAVGGAINFISKEPNRDRFTSEALVSYGSWDTARFGVGVGGPAGKTGLSYRGDFSHQSSDTFLRHGGLEMNHFSAALRYDVSERLAVTLHVDAMNDDFDAYFGTPLAEGKLDERIARINYNVRDNVMRSESYWLRLKTEWNPSEAVRVNNLLYGYRADREWKNAEGTEYDPAAGTVRYWALGIVEHEQDLAGNRLETLVTHEIAGRENRLAIGGDIKRTDFFRQADFPDGNAVVDAFHPRPVTYVEAGGPSTPGSRGAEYEIFQAAPFLENQFSLWPNLKLVGGIRYDLIDDDVHNLDTGLDYGKTFHPVTGRGGLVWNPVKAVTVYGQYSTAAGAPRALVNQNSAFDFSLEETRQIEFGVKGQPWDGKFEASAAYFNIVKDRVRLIRDRVTNQRIGEPGGQTLSHGVEFEAAAHFAEGWTAGANFTVLDTGIDHSGFADDGRRPSNVPRRMAGLFGSYRFPIGVEIGADARYVGNRLGNDPSGPRFRMDGYTLLGLHLSYNWKQLTFLARGRNVTDERYLAWAEDDYGNQAIVGAPASVEFEMRWRF